MKDLSLQKDDSSGWEDRLRNTCVARKGLTEEVRCFFKHHQKELVRENQKKPSTQKVLPAKKVEFEGERVKDFEVGS